MRIQLGTAASLTMASLLAFSGAAMATGNEMYNYHPKGGTTPAAPVGPINNSAHAVGGEAEARANASSKAYGGTGGNGYGGAGGKAMGGSVGPLSLSNQTNYEAQGLQQGNAVPLVMMMGGSCPQAVGGGFTVPGGSLTIGVGGQDKVCMAKDVAMQLINQGIIIKKKNDKGEMEYEFGMIVGGLATLRKALPDVDEGFRVAIHNLMMNKECVEKAKSISLILLSDENFGCTKDNLPVVDDPKYRVVAPAKTETEAKKPQTKTGHDFVLNP